MKENIVPFFNQVIQYLRENFKPALQKFGRFVAIKCRALTGYAEQLFSRVSQYLQRLELRRRLANAFANILVRVSEFGEAVIRVLGIQIRIGFINLLRDFNGGFFPIVEAILIDLMHVGRIILIQFGRINYQIIQGVWNDVKEKFKRVKNSIKASFARLGTKIKAAIKTTAKKLGKKAIAVIKTKLLHPLWEKVKSDWRKLMKLVFSPRWRRWFANIVDFCRKEIDQHPRVRDKLQEIWNVVENHVHCMVWAIILLVVPSKSVWIHK